MAISEKELKNLAKLAKLEFSDEELKKFACGFDEMIAFCDGINAEAGTAFPREGFSGAESVGYENLREDEVVEGLSQAEVLSNVQGERGYFTVKRVVK